MKTELYRLDYKGTKRKLSLMWKTLLDCQTEIVSLETELTQIKTSIDQLNIALNSAVSALQAYGES